MIGTTLADIREHIESLAGEDGTYYVACGRTGERPVPAAGLRFDSRSTARAALRATEQYRRALRRYDPRTPRYDLIVCQEAPSPSQGDGAAWDPAADDDRALAEPAFDGADATRRQRMEFCHRVAAAVFETLSESGFDGVETAVMDAYLELAETVADPDDLCLRLLESLATEFDDRLAPRAQADVLADAAAQLAPADDSAEPVLATLSVLERRGLVGDFTCAPATVDRASGTRSVLVTLSDYALAPRDGRLPVLPLVVELHRHRPEWSPSGVRVTEVDEGWRVAIEFGTDPDPNGLSTVPIRPEE